MSDRDPRASLLGIVMAIETVLLLAQTAVQFPWLVGGIDFVRRFL